MENRDNLLRFACNHGAGVSPQRLDDLEYDDGQNGGDRQRPQNRRPRRSAQARRQQQLRSDARHTVRLVKGLRDIMSHRGNQLGEVGEALLEILSRTSQPTDKATWHSARVVPHQPNSGYAVTPSMCRHHLVGRCTWGSQCRFSHSGETYSRHNNGADVGDHNDSYDDYNEDNDDNHEYVHTDDNNYESHNDDQVRAYDDNTQHDNYVQHEHDSNGNDDNARAHDDKVQRDNHEVDDVSKIISILRGLDDQDRQQAIKRLSPSLYLDVLNRLAESQQRSDDTQVTDDDDPLHPQREDTPQCSRAEARSDVEPQHDAQSDSDSDAIPSLYYPDTGRCTNDIATLNGLYSQTNKLLHYEELVLDYALRARVHDLLRNFNYNKKPVRQMLGREVMREVFPSACSREDAIPDARPSGSNIEIQRIPDHSGDELSHAATQIAEERPIGSAAAIPSSIAETKQEQHSTTFTEQVREVLSILTFPQRWDAFSSLPQQTRDAILDSYPEIMHEESEHSESHSDNEHET